MLELIDPMHLTAEDIALLYTADEAGPWFYHLPAEEIVQRLWNGEMFLYRGNGTVVLTELHESLTGKRFNLVRLAGKNSARSFQQLAVDLQHAARELGCNAIETMVFSEKLTRALARTGLKREATIMVLELNDGR